MTTVSMLSYKVLLLHEIIFAGSLANDSWTVLFGGHSDGFG